MIYPDFSRKEYGTGGYTADENFILWQPGPGEKVTLFRHPDSGEMVTFAELGMTLDEWRRVLAAQEETGAETGL